MGGAGRRRGPQRPYRCRVPRTRRSLRRRPRTPPRHRRCRRHRGARSWIQVLSLQLPPKPPPTFHRQVYIIHFSYA